MLLYLLRHAEAVAQASSDADRELSEKGVRQAARVGKFCATNDLVPEIILTSPLRRTKQTARLVASELGEPEVSVASFLASGMSPDSALEELKAYAKLQSVMLVGHEPDFGHLIARLLGAEAACVKVRKASLTLLEIEALRSGGAQLQFSIPSRFL